MQVTPKTEEELQKENLIPEGTFPFEVLKAEDTLSKAGNEMIKLTLKVYDNEGGWHMVFDYLIEGRMSYKIRHFCETTGLIDRYNAGRVDAYDCEHRTGTVIIKHRKDKEDPNKLWVVVEDYDKNSTSSAGQVATQESMPDDDIPF